MISKPKYEPGCETIEELKNRFVYHKPKDDQPERYEIMRKVCGELAILIVESTPQCREQSLALTHLDEVSMFANAAIARHE